MGGETSKLPVTLGEEVSGYSHPYWKMYRGTNKEAGYAVSIFAFDKTAHPDELPLAQNAVKFMRKLRHPGVLRLEHAVEMQNSIYLVTEPVEPLDMRCIGEHYESYPYKGSDGEEAKSDSSVEKEMQKRREYAREVIVAINMHGLCSTLQWIHEECKLSHNNLQPSSVFVACGDMNAVIDTPADSALLSPSLKGDQTTVPGSWKLGGFDLISAISDTALCIDYGAVSLSKAYRPLEWSTHSGVGAGARKYAQTPVHATDAWGVGALLSGLFRQGSTPERTGIAYVGSNYDQYAKGSGVKPLNADSKDQSSLRYPYMSRYVGLSEGANLGQTHHLPPSAVEVYKKLLSRDTRTRPTMAQVLQASFFTRNKAVGLSRFLGALKLKNANERAEYMSTLHTKLPLLAEFSQQMHILPLLVKSMSSDRKSSLSSGPASVKLNVTNIGYCLHAALSIVKNSGGKGFPHAVDGTVGGVSGRPTVLFRELVESCVLELYKSNSRAVRAHLLTQLGLYAGWLSDNAVSGAFMEAYSSGFRDASPPLRELTVKSLAHLAPHISHSVFDSKILRLLSTLQQDKDPGVRTATCYCIAKISPHLSIKSRNRVLISAFSRALRDPFPGCRIAGIASFVITQQYHNPRMLARRIIPAISPLLVDHTSSEVRGAALQSLQDFVPKLSQYSELLDQHGIEGVERMEKEQAARVQSQGVLSKVSRWALTSMFGSSKSSTQSSTPLSKPAERKEPQSTASTGAHRATPAATSTATTRSGTSSRSAVTITPADSQEDLFGADDDWGDLLDGSDVDESNIVPKTTRKSRTSTTAATTTTTTTAKSRKKADKSRSGGGDGGFGFGSDDDFGFSDDDGFGFGSEDQNEAGNSDGEEDIWGNDTPAVAKSAKKAASKTLRGSKTSTKNKSSVRTSSKPKSGGSAELDGDFDDFMSTFVSKNGDKSSTKTSTRASKKSNTSKKPSASTRTASSTSEKSNGRKSTASKQAASGDDFFGDMLQDLGASSSAVSGTSAAAMFGSSHAPKKSTTRRGAEVKKPAARKPSSKPTTSKPAPSKPTSSKPANDDDDNPWDDMFPDDSPKKTTKPASSRMKATQKPKQSKSTAAISDGTGDDFWDDMLN